MTPVSDLLSAIVAATRHIVLLRSGSLPLAGLERAAAEASPRAADFRTALAAPGTINVIAECKRRSPSRGVLVRNYDPAAIAKQYVAGGAVAISVLTEPTFFDGSLDHLRVVRAAVDLPILRKDFIVSEYQIVEARVAGADAVLLIVGALTDEDLHALLAQTRRHGLAALVEVHDPGELRRALDAGADIVGVNNRNLRTLEVNARTAEDLAASIPSEVVAVAESGLKDPADVQALHARGYRAFLVGESLMTSGDPGAALRSFRGASTAPVTVVTTALTTALTIDARP